MQSISIQDRLGVATILLPILGTVMVMISGLLSFGGAGLVICSVMGGLLVLMLSIPFAAVVAFRSRGIDRPRFRMAVGGLITASLLAIMIVASMRAAIAKARNVEAELNSEQVEHGSGSDS